MPRKNKFDQFKHHSYRIVDIGRTATFHIPAEKLQLQTQRVGKKRGTIEKRIHRFLKRKFGGYHNHPVPSTGVWVSPTEQIFFDNCIPYHVSFLGKKRIPQLLKFFSGLAREMGEECILFSMGEDAALLYPNPV